MIQVLRIFHTIDYFILILYSIYFKKDYRWIFQSRVVVQHVDQPGQLYCFFFLDRKSPRFISGRFYSLEILWNDIISMFCFLFGKKIAKIFLGNQIIENFEIKTCGKISESELQTICAKYKDQ